MNMDINFSHTNMQYLIQLRDMARQQPALVELTTGLPRDLIGLLAQIKAEALASFAQINTPAFLLRPEPWWWGRLIHALLDNRHDEIQAILAHARLAMLTPATPGGAH